MLRTLLFAHRWLGVALCLLFLLWFPSGIAIMYFGYPEVTERDRLARASDLDASTILHQPSDIFGALGRPGPPFDLRLQTYHGRPVYRLTDPGGAVAVYADSGALVDTQPVAPGELAAAWAGQPAAVAEVSPVIDVDQWTLQLPVARLQPLWKYRFPSGDEVYVSAATGDVVQHTTRQSRLGAYVGPIPHWIYFTPIRKHGQEWTRLVIWSSAAATVAAIIGVVLGAWLTVPQRRIPYTGQKRWHLLLGLLFGVATVTWAFSGMLSMDPFPSLSGGAARRSDAVSGASRALRGELRMSDFLRRTPQAALQMLANQSVRELAYASAAGEPVYIATLADGGTRVVPMAGPVRNEVDRARVIAAVQDAARVAGGASISELREYDAYYRDRRGELPLPVLLVRLNDQDETRFYVDPRRGRVVGSYSSQGWTNRWLYHGLHSLDFPWLYRYRPLWDLVVIAFMLGGTALTVTSLVLAWRVVGRTLSSRV